MRYLVTSEEMKKYDAYTINEIGISDEVLMERAALFSVELVLEQGKKIGKKPEEIKTLVVCGVGNNGGDGLAAARLLLEQNCRADVYLVGDLKRETPLRKKQRLILEKYNVVPSPVFPKEEYDVIIDALFGIGLSREVAGEYREVIADMNRKKAWKLALDVPSGIDASTGRIWGEAVRADMTAAFAYAKRGLYLYPGTSYAGKVRVGNIGIGEKCFTQCPPEMFFLESSPDFFLPKRNPAGNKGTFGKVLCIAGSAQMAGAAILCQRAAFRAGAGMVKAVTAKENREILLQNVPEAMLLAYESEECEKDEEKTGKWWQQFAQSLLWADCILAGPGMDKTKMAKEMLRFVLEHSGQPLVLDADALNLLAEDCGLQELLQKNIRERKRTVVMTPHAGELARLLSANITEVKEDFVKAARSAAQKFNCIMVCKDARTIVCKKDGIMYLNVTGNSGMATAGSGDVLAGVTAALYAAGGGGMEKAVLSVYLHGRAGDCAAEKLGEAAVMASDIIEALAVIQKGN